MYILYYQYLYSTPENQPNKVIELLVCDVLFLSLPQWDSDQYCGDIIATLSALCPAIYIKFAELIYSILRKKCFRIFQFTLYIFLLHAMKYIKGIGAFQMVNL